jgi:UDP-GlcNAc:undecaprenyl-phosphate GlcNAc-1-phosphate transferase
MNPPLAALYGVATACAATPLLAALARRRGWLDRAEGEAAVRKLQARGVPPVGGLAVLLGLAVTTAALRLSGGHWDPEIASWVDPRAGAAALVLAFLAGAVDDLAPGGVRPRPKLALQALAALPLSVSVWLHRLAEVPGEPGLAALLALALLFGAVLAQNLFNTFDNADGATTSLGILALAWHAPVFAGPLLGFLPWNLNARVREGARATPTAYLGDAGSHLLGLLILLVPAAWPALALPLFDLARLCVRRLRVGSKPWIGDRRHLAHRLAHAGLRPLGVCLMLLVVALPGVARPDALGLCLTALFFAAAVALTREPGPLPD